MLALQDSIYFKALGEALRGRGREIACCATLLVTASCVPLQAAPAPGRHRAPRPLRCRRRRGRRSPSRCCFATSRRPKPPRINAAIPFSAEPNPRRAPRPSSGPPAPADQFRSLQCLAEADLLRGPLRERGRPARRRPGRPQPGPPPGLSGQRLRSRLSGAAARRRRLPVHLHLRRLAASAAVRRRLGPGPPDRRRGAGRLRLRAGRPRHQLSHPAGPPDLGLPARQVERDRQRTSSTGCRAPGAGPRAFSQTYRGREPSPATVMAARLPINLGRRAARRSPRRSTWRASPCRRLHAPAHRRHRGAARSGQRPAAAIDGQGGVREQRPLSRRPARANSTAEPSRLPRRDMRQLRRDPQRRAAALTSPGPPGTPTRPSSPASRRLKASSRPIA